MTKIVLSMSLFTLFSCSNPTDLAKLTAGAKSPQNTVKSMTSMVTDTPYDRINPKIRDMVIETVAKNHTVLLLVYYHDKKTKRLLSETPYVCSGVIIGDITVATAAQCLNSKLENLKNYSDDEIIERVVVIYEDHVDLQNFDVAKVFNSRSATSAVSAEDHDDFSINTITSHGVEDTTYKNDISLLKLDPDIEMPSIYYKAPIFKGKLKPNHPNRLASFGYGSIGVGIDLNAGILRYMNDPMLVSMTSTELKVDTKKLGYVTKGDIGGPLFVYKNNEANLVGILSYSSGEIATYTYIEAYRSWINSILEKFGDPTRI